MQNNSKQTQTKSVHLRLNTELIKEIDSFSDEYKFTNRTEAIRFLIVHGIKYQALTEKLLKENLKK